MSHVPSLIGIRDIKCLDSTGLVHRELLTLKPIARA
jgi:hypothetical protein